MSRAISERQRVARKQWKERLLEWEQSDMSQTSYCRQEGLNLRNFQYWRRKYRQIQSPGTTSKNNSMVKLVELQPENCNAGQFNFFKPGSPMKLQVGDIAVELENHFSPEALVRLIQVLRTV